MEEDVQRVTLWRSYFTDAGALPDRDRLQYYDALFGYVFDEVEPEFTGKSAPFLRMIWNVVKPNLDASLAKQKAGASGGKANAKQPASRTEANAKQNGSKTQANAEQTASDARLREKGDGNRDKGIKGEDTPLTPLGEAEEAKPKQTRFTPPSPEEVGAFVREKGYTFVDPVRFCAFYGSKGWKVGNQPMKDWRMAAAGWESREKKEREGASHDFGEYGLTF